MAWDSSRPVPWTRLTREWFVYAAIMGVLFALFFRDNSLVGAIAGLVASLPLYLGLGALLAKLGYQRKSLRQLRTASTPSEPSADAPQQRPRPEPTRRTSSGPSNRPRSSSKRRR